MYHYNYKDLPDKTQIPIDAAIFYCNHCKLDKIPKLHYGLRYLCCTRNNLTELPELPITLEELGCEENKLTALPELPARLVRLICNHNNLTFIPELPVGLKELWCHYNNIGYLSPYNCQVIKNIELQILNNPVSEGFNSNDEFKAMLFYE